MALIEKFKGMEQTEKESYIKEMNGLDLADLMQEARNNKVSSSDVALLCRWMKVRMNSAHEMGHYGKETIEKIITILSCGNERHLQNYQAETAKGFVHPDIAERAFSQLLSDYSPLITDYSKS